MSMEYIRRAYGVPAKRGGRVERLTAKYQGTIVSSDGARLRILWDGETRPRLHHPTDGIVYLDGPSP
jgi:hypothetical protein